MPTAPATRNKVGRARVCDPCTEHEDSRYDACIRPQADLDNRLPIFNVRKSLVRNRARRESSPWKTCERTRLLLLSALLAIPALAPCQPSVPPVPPVSPGGRPYWVADAFFVFHSDALEAEKRERLLKVALEPLRRAPSECPFAQWVVVGHADASEGNPVKSNQLARQRADYIAQLLVRHGAQPRDICTLSRGSTQPLAPSPAPKNARVEMEIQCVWAAPPQCTQ